MPSGNILFIKVFNGNTKINISSVELTPGYKPMDVAITASCVTQTWPCGYVMAARPPHDLLAHGHHTLWLPY